ncbi:MAG: carbon-nitrogen family hydrolase [Alcanivoracaceae bacterium]|nr:carbon-nitrogen family hydrolase [Alcanivoracaceae bacterium]
MKIASIQLNIVWENRRENLHRAEKFIQQAQVNACDLVIFPEMFNSGFSMNSAAVAERPGGLSSQKLSELAKKHHINIIAGLTEINDNQASNMALMINRQGIIKAKYIKNYPYSHAGEDQSYMTGNQQVVFEIDGVKASVFICYDLRFPELFRKVAKQVQVIFVIASWPETRQDHWQTLLKARAIENQCFIVGVNRIGKDGNGLNYIGGSQVFDPFGVSLSKGGIEQEYLVTELDLLKVDTIRQELPFLQDIK